MLQGERATTRFQWWTPREAKVRMRAHEIQARLRWAVAVRWFFVGLGALGTVVAAAEVLPARLDPWLLALCTTYLASSNLLFHILLTRAEAGVLRPRRFLSAQALSDFICLSTLSYSLGSVETPITVLFLPHIILLTLLLTGRVSLMMSVVAAGMASLPLLLVRLGWLPVVSIFDSDLPTRISESWALTLGLSASTLACFTTSWYLVSQVSNGLVLRERRLEQDHRRLQKSAHNKTLATLHATHELKAPLAAIKSYVYTLRDGYAGTLPSAAHKIIARIGDRCDVLTQRITNIIHLSNLETLRHNDLLFRAEDLYDLVRAECEEAGQRALPRGVKVQLSRRPSEDVTVWMAQGELQSLLGNLLDNAVEYSHPEGLVEVELRSEPAAVQLRISDHGIGIAPENVARVFSEHFRAENAVAHKPIGSGLGLAIVKEIARLHNAEVHIASELSKGTEVTVRFPHPAHTLGGLHGPHPHR